MKKKKSSPKSNFTRIWDYIFHNDSLGSLLTFIIVASIFIKFIFFPVIGFFLDTSYPVVAIVTGSMEHKIVDNKVCDKIVLDTKSKRLTHDEFWTFCGKYYEKNFDLSKQNFEEFPFKKGLNIGDVMILYGRDIEDIKIGDVLVFIPQDKNTQGESVFFNNFGPVIHRVIGITQDEEGKYHFQTKGDHNPLSGENFETDIPEEDVLGVGVVRIPFIGYVKLFVSKAISFAWGLFL